VADLDSPRSLRRVARFRYNIGLPRAGNMIVTFPNSPYELHQPFQPAGDQPEAIEHLVEGLTDGLAFQTLLGVTGSGKTYTMPT
jgi:hypothetical protein